MIAAIKQFILRLINMLSIGIDVGEDLMYSGKNLSGYAREGTEMFAKEARLERADHISTIEERIRAKGINVDSH